MKHFLALLVLCATVSGCSDFDDPTKRLTLESVVGGGPSLAKGMTRDEVLEKWGHPDNVKFVGETRWGAPIERWTYHAWLSDFPVDYRYVSVGRRLFFEGNALARWEDIEKKRRLRSRVHNPKSEICNPKSNVWSPVGHWDTGKNS